jgi:hypothetical protein
MKLFPISLVPKLSIALIKSSICMRLLMHIFSLVLRDSVLGVRLSLKPWWYRSHLLCVARNAHVLSGYLKCKRLTNHTVNEDAGKA